VIHSVSVFALIYIVFVFALVHFVSVFALSYFVSVFALNSESKTLHFVYCRRLFIPISYTRYFNNLLHIKLST